MFYAGFSFCNAEKLNFHHGISMLHELKYGPGFEHFDYINPNAPKGGAIKFSTSANVRNFAGEFDNNNDGPPGVGFVYDTLIVLSRDELGGFYGRLAKSMAVSSDGLLLAFRLHPEAKFHDGTPVTSKDVKYTVDWILSTVEGGLYLGWIKSVEAVSEREVHLHLKEPLDDSNLRSWHMSPVFSQNTIGWGGTLLRRQLNSRWAVVRIRLIVGTKVISASLE